MIKQIKFLVACLLVITGFEMRFALAQEPREVKCGDTVDSEFIKDGEAQIFNIRLPARAVLSVTGSVVGDTLRIYLDINDPINRNLASSNWDKTPSTKTGVLSASGVYEIRTHSSGIGLYSFTVNCSGVSVTPQPSSTKSSSPSTANNPVPTLPIDFFGFRGLPAVDFANASDQALELDTPLTDAIDSNATAASTYSFEAKAKQSLDLNFKRLSGNVNMGIVVIGPDKKTLFQVSLIESDTFNTTIKLPADGKYTIGVYRVELNPPAKPKATSFELTATVK